MISDEQWYWIWLYGVDGVGIKTFTALVKHFTSAKEVFLAKPKRLTDFGLNKKVLKALLARKKSFDMDKTQEFLQKHDIVPIFDGDKAYPRQLGVLEPPPLILWQKGDYLEMKKHPHIAIVGSRNFTEYGREITQYFAEQLAGGGAVIVSGLAVGIDSIAHDGALDSGGRALAIVGYGLADMAESLTTGTKRRLWDKAVVLSPYNLRTRGAKYTFPYRNSVIAALSDAVLVTQAKEGSGALITAADAKEFGKPVFVVSGDVRSWAYKGSHNLIKSGDGILVEDANEILSAVGSGRSSEKDDMSRLSDDDRKIVNVLLDGVVDMHEIQARTGFSSEILLQLLSDLELESVVERSGGVYRLKKHI